MEKNTLVGLGAIIIVLGALVWYAALHPTTAKAPTDSGTASSTLMSVTPYSEHGEYYDIAMNFPTTTPLTGEANTAAVAAMQGWVQNTVSSFKQPAGTDLNLTTLTADEAEKMGLSAEHKYTLQTSYLIGSSEHTISYIFTVYVDTGGAHGNIFFKTFVFDKNTGNLLSLSDLFQNNVDYLNALSSMARTRLAASLGTSGDTKVIQAGTTPDDANFQNFFFDGTDFVVVFPPYQVAAYAAGPQTLRIASADLKNILKSTYP